MWLLLPILVPYYMVMWPFILIQGGIEELENFLGKYIDLDRLFSF